MEESFSPETNKKNNKPEPEMLGDYKIYYFMMGKYKKYHIVIILLLFHTTPFAQAISPAIDEKTNNIPTGGTPPLTDGFIMLITAALFYVIIVYKKNIADYFDKKK